MTVAEGVAAALGLIAIWQTFRANRFSKKVAENEGVFNQPNLSLELYNYDCREFIFAVPTGAIPILVPLTFSIRNAGDSSAKSVEVLIRANKSILPLKRSLLNRTTSQGVKVTAAIVNEEAHTQTLMYSLQNVHPKQQIDLVSNALISSPTISNFEIPVRSKDGKNLKVKGNILYKHHIDATVFQENGSPLVKTLFVTVVNVSGRPVKEALEEYNRVAQQKRTEKSTTPWKRWLYLGKRQQLTRLRLIVMDEEKLDRSNREAWVAPLEALSSYDGLIMPDRLVFVPGVGVDLKQASSETNSVVDA